MSDHRFTEAVPPSGDDDAGVDAPYVCPDCYAVGGEPCVCDCIEAAMARDYDEDDTYERDDCNECDCSRCLADNARWESWQGWDDDGGANGDNDV